MTQPRYRAVVVVGTTREGNCGHCGSADVIADDDGWTCGACVHRCAYWGGPPPPKTAEEIASSFRGSSG